jgi:alpha,alpha-trehalase
MQKLNSQAAVTNLFDCHPLFEDVQMNHVFEDGKTFVDSVPRTDVRVILQQYLEQKDLHLFNLKEFVLTHFDLPQEFASNFKTDVHQSLDRHIRQLWSVLTRQPDGQKGSLIALPHSFIVPGGRFREIYYWDSYFTMLGLHLHGHVDMIENMVNNFTYLIQNFGHIPNGNRTYYLSRSQPPYFALMVELLANSKNDDRIYVKYLPALQQEYDFWQLGAKDNMEAKLRTVKLEGGEILNRYFDESPTPRPESYFEDMHFSKKNEQTSEEFFTNIRAAAESGWDFSTRWFADHLNMATIETVNIIPVDLNCLLYKLEKILAKAYSLDGKINEAQGMETDAAKRLGAILKYCWNEKYSFFTDYNWAKKSICDQITAAGLTPLFVAAEDNPIIKSKVDQIATTVKEYLLQPGGLVTTTISSGQQWDWPNGWAPLQWIAVKGLQNFGKEKEAQTIAQNWVSLNEKVFNATGKMMEKYDVVDTTKLAGGGEYESQEGFGWTNGVYLALKNYLKDAG